MLLSGAQRSCMSRLGSMVMLSGDSLPSQRVLFDLSLRLIGASSADRSVTFKR